MSFFSSGEMSVELLHVIDVTKNYIRKEGFCYPALHIFNKGEPINIDIKADNIVAQQSNDDIESFDEDFVYHTVIAFSISEDKDEDAIQKVADQIARDYKPGGISLVISCIFRSDEDVDRIVKEKDPVKRQELRDTSGMHMLHICGFLPYTEDYLMKMVPYENYGKVEGDMKSCSVEELKIKKLKEAFKNEELSRNGINGSMSGDGPYNVGFCDYPWVNDSTNIEPKLRNPYTY